MANEMKWGVVAAIDALGFKGAWRENPEHVLRKLHDVKEKFEREIRQGERIAQVAAAHGLPTVPEFHVHFQSDSVLFAVIAADQRTATPLLWTVCASVAVASRAEPDDACPLLYRGAVALGKVLADDHFMVGEAVDAAGENMEQAEAGIVWLTPSALEAPEVRAVLAEWLPRPFLPYEVPLKGGRTFDTFAVNPFHGLEAANLQPWVDRGLDRFGKRPPLDLAIKKQNTEKFFKAAIESLDSTSLARQYAKQAEGRE